MTIVDIQVIPFRVPIIDNILNIILLLFNRTDNLLTFIWLLSTWAKQVELLRPYPQRRIYPQKNWMSKNCRVFYWTRVSILETKLG